ncbi:hypothetical protein [Labrenzia sp. DG1229]|uniref:hypothetical protein n=1 Tax=Labrenzia sp. DG1229 TaxID=681847 RepID=UPI000AF22A2A|nr:hypothetical protein [Labrenzia sp. DG1229]
MKLQSGNPTLTSKTRTLASPDRPVRHETPGIAGFTSPRRIGLIDGSGGHEWNAAGIWFVRPVA